MSEDIGIEIGDADYSGGGFKRHDLKKGVDNIHRILPPVGKGAASGTWVVDHAVEWGFKTSDDKHRTFECVQVKDPKTKMIVTRCPACDRRAKLQAEYDAKLAKTVEFLVKEKGHTEDQAQKVAAAKLQPYEAVLKRYNRSFRMYMNTINDRGEIGVLNMSFAHFLILKKKINELRAEGIDPLAVRQGAWFNFTYSTNRDHAVEVLMVGNLTGAQGKVLKPAALTDAVLKRLKNEVCKDLTDLNRRLTVEQIQKLVDSGGDGGVVDSIFGRGEVKEMADKTPDLGSALDIPDFDVGTPTQSQPVQQAPQAQAVPQAAVQVAAKPAASPTAPLSPPDVNVSDEEFADLFKDMK